MPNSVPIRDFKELCDTICSEMCTHTYSLHRWNSVSCLLEDR